MSKLALKSFVKIPASFLLSGIFLFTVNAQTKIEKLTSTDKPVVDSTSNSTASSAPKGALNRHSVGLGFGQTFMVGDFKHTGEDKITFDVFYNYSASHSFDLLVNIHSSKHEFRNYHTSVRGIAPGIKAKLYQFDNFAPYALAGLGIYAPKLRREVNGQIQETKSKMAFGYHVGAGADLNLNSHASVGLLFHLHNPFDVKQDLGPEVEGAYYKLMMLAFYVF